MSKDLSTYLRHMVLDNRVPGKVTGELLLHGMNDPVMMDLVGDFDRDSRGARMHLYGSMRKNTDAMTQYLRDLACKQTGKMTANTIGKPSASCTATRIAWRSPVNGLVVIEIKSDQVVVDYARRPPMIPTFSRDTIE